MTAPQGTFSFPGIDGTISASVTFALGISPSVTSVTMAPNPSLTQLGTAVWSYGGTAIRTLPNSVVDEIRVSRAGGATTWIVSILDRRWTWEYGQISGEYNIEIDDNVIATSEKTPRALAILCLEAMGEVGYDVSMVPLDDRPYVNWEIEVPAKALAELLELYGLTVTLRIDNTVAVVQLGTGGNLPPEALVVEDTVQPAAVPSKLRVVTAPAQWQVDFETEAVGAETDGTIVPIDDLTYTPVDGWEDKDPIDFEFLTDKEENRAAKDTVRKWYRIKLPEIDSSTTTTTTSTTPDPSVPQIGPTRLELPDITVAIEELYQLLPILDQSVGSKGDDRSKTQARAIVWGKYYDGHTLGSTNTTETITNEDYDESLDIDQSYSVNTELGVVQFSEPCILMDEDPGMRDGSSPGSTKGTSPAQVFIRCQTNVRDKDTREPQRRFREVDIDLTSPAPIKYVTREDIIPRYWKDGFGDWTNNLTEVDEKLDFYIAQEIFNFQTFPGSTADYAGFVQIAPDGALRQIAYSIGADGLATSKVTRNIERFEMSLSFKEARQRQKLAADRERSQRGRKKQPKRLTPRASGKD